MNLLIGLGFKLVLRTAPFYASFNFCNKIRIIRIIGFFNLETNIERLHIRFYFLQGFAIALNDDGFNDYSTL